MGRAAVQGLKGALAIGQLTKLKTLFLQANPLDAFSRALLQRLEARGVKVEYPYPPRSARSRGLGQVGHRA